jgi:hypothetical protein
MAVDEYIVIDDYLEDNIVHAKRQVHDCVDTGADLAVSTTEILYPCDCATRDYKSGDPLWDNTTSIFKNGIQDSVILVKWSFTSQSTVPGRKMTIKIVIPDPAGDIPIETVDYFIDTQNQDEFFGNSRQYYNGPEALLYGFKITIVGDGSFTLKDRSISIAVV